MSIRNEACGMCLCHESGALRNGICALIKETQESALIYLFIYSLCIMCSKNTVIYEPGSKQALTKQGLLAPCSWTLYPIELREVHVCYLLSLHSILVTAA